MTALQLARLLFSSPLATSRPAVFVCECAVCSFINIFLLFRFVWNVSQQMCKRWMMVFRIVWVVCALRCVVSQFAMRMSNCHSFGSVPCKCHGLLMQWNRENNTRTHTSKLNRKWAMVWMILIWPAKRHGKTAKERVRTSWSSFMACALCFFSLLIYLLLLKAWLIFIAVSTLFTDHLTFITPSHLMISCVYKMNCVFALLCFEFN